MVKVITFVMEKMEAPVVPLFSDLTADAHVISGKNPDSDTVRPRSYTGQALGIATQDGIGHERNLAAAPRGVDNIGGYGIAAGKAA